MQDVPYVGWSMTVQTMSTHSHIQHIQDLLPTVPQDSLLKWLALVETLADPEVPWLRSEVILRCMHRSHLKMTSQLLRGALADD